MITCNFENGRQVNLRHVVVDTLVLKGDKVLLTKRAPQLLEGGKWALAGGYVDRDETIQEAVRREILEETGHEITNLQLLKVVDSPHRPRENNRQNISFVFFCEAGEQVGEMDHEVTELRWFDLEDLPAREEIAFDHLESINSYKKWKQQPYPLPAAFVEP